MSWLDEDLLLLVAELAGVTVELVTVERDAWNVHLTTDEVLVLDLSGAGRHKLMCLDVWALSMEWRSMPGFDGSAAG